MELVWQSIVAGLPVFAAHFITAIAVLAAAIFMYVHSTPHKEFELIRQGNVAAAVSLSAAIIGLALPLAFCLEGSVNTYDIVLWGTAILLIQIATYRMIDALLKNLSQAIETQRMAPVLLLAAIKLSVAMLNAAAIAS